MDHVTDLDGHDVWTFPRWVQLSRRPYGPGRAVEPDLILDYASTAMPT
jgi:hypothetical protein